MGRAIWKNCNGVCGSGCAVITSNRGGLVETFDNDLIKNKITHQNYLKRLNF